MRGWIERRWNAPSTVQWQTAGAALGLAGVLAFLTHLVGLDLSRTERRIVFGPFLLVWAVAGLRWAVVFGRDVSHRRQEHWGTVVQWAKWLTVIVVFVAASA